MYSDHNGNPHGFSLSQQILLSQSGVGQDSLVLIPPDEHAPQSQTPPAFGPSLSILNRNSRTVISEFTFAKFAALRLRALALARTCRNLHFLTLTIPGTTASAAFFVDQQIEAMVRQLMQRIRKAVRKKAQKARIQFVCAFERKDPFSPLHAHLMIDLPLGQEISESFILEKWISILEEISTEFKTDLFESQKGMSWRYAPLDALVKLQSHDNPKVAAEYLSKIKHDGSMQKIPLSINGYPASTPSRWGFASKDVGAALKTLKFERRIDVSSFEEGLVFIDEELKPLVEKFSPLAPWRPLTQRFAKLRVEGVTTKVPLERVDHLRRKLAKCFEVKRRNSLVPLPLTGSVKIQVVISVGIDGYTVLKVKCLPLTAGEKRLQKTLKATSTKAQVGV